MGRRDPRFGGTARYRIVSDGNAHNTEIFGPDGKRMKNVKQIKIAINGDNPTVLIELELYVDDFEYEGPANIKETPWPEKKEERHAVGDLQRQIERLDKSLDERSARVFDRMIRDA